MIDCFDGMVVSWSIGTRPDAELVTIEEFVAALDSYIRWYNEARIKISMGSRSPIETVGISDGLLSRPRFPPRPLRGHSKFPARSRCFFAM